MAWSALSRLVVIAVSLAATIVLARILEPRDFGLLTMAMVFIGVAQQARDFGVGQALVRMETLTEAAQETAFTYALLISSGIYLVLFVLAEPVAALYGEPAVSPVLRVIALSFPMTAFAVVPTALLRRNLTLRGEALATTVSALADSAITIALALGGFGVWALAAGKVVGVAALVIALFVACPWRPGLRFRGEERRELLGFGGGVTLSSLLWYGYTNADFLIIGRMLGSVALGVYTISWNIAKMPWDRLWLIINPLVLPLFSRARAEPAEMGRAFCRVTAYTALLTFPAVAGLAAVSDDIVAVILGPRWEQARIPMIWLCALGVVRSVAVLWAPVLLSAGHLRQVVGFNLLCFFILPAGFLAGQSWGIQGVAFAWVALYPVLAVLLLLPRTLAVAGVSATRYLRILGPPALATSLMLGGVLLVGAVLPAVPILRLIVRVGIGAIIYVLAVRLLVGPIAGELRGLIEDTRRGVLGSRVDLEPTTVE